MADACSENSPVGVMDEMMTLRTESKLQQERIADAYSKKAPPQYQIDDSDIEEDSDDEEHDALKDLSMILEECFGSSLSDDSKPISITTSPKNYRAQLKQSKQVIQMLFNDLKTSKQNEAILSEKLRASHFALRHERQRSRENTRIAMRSADEVRANFVSKMDPSEKALLPPYSAASELDRLKRELGQAREECLKWKQKAQSLPEVLPEVPAVHGLEADLYPPTDEERVVTQRKRNKVKSRSKVPNKTLTPIRNAHMDAPPAMVVCTPKAVDKRKKSKNTPRTPKLKTDSNLMQELLASKERLQSAETKLRMLVNAPELFDCRGLIAHCEEPSDVQDEEVAVQLVKTFDEAVEVSHRHLHTFGSERLG